MSVIPDRRGRIVFKELPFGLSSPPSYTLKTPNNISFGSKLVHGFTKNEQYMWPRLNPHDRSKLFTASNCSTSGGLKSYFEIKGVQQEKRLPSNLITSFVDSPEVKYVPVEGFIRALNATDSIYDGELSEYKFSRLSEDGVYENDSGFVSDLRSWFTSNDLDDGVSPICLSIRFTVPRKFDTLDGPIFSFEFSGPKGSHTINGQQFEGSGRYSIVVYSTGVIRLFEVIPAVSIVNLEPNRVILLTEKAMEFVEIAGSINLVFAIYRKKGTAKTGGFISVDVLGYSKTNKSSMGFTLIELLVQLAVVSIQMSQFKHSDVQAVTLNSFTDSQTIGTGYLHFTGNPLLLNVFIQPAYCRYRTDAKFTEPDIPLYFPRGGSDTRNLRLTSVVDRTGGAKVEFESSIGAKVSESEKGDLTEWNIMGAVGSFTTAITCTVKNTPDECVWIKSTMIGLDGTHPVFSNTNKLIVNSGALNVSECIPYSMDIDNCRMTFSFTDASLEQYAKMLSKRQEWWVELQFTDELPAVYNTPEDMPSQVTTSLQDITPDNKWVTVFSGMTRSITNVSKNPTWVTYEVDCRTIWEYVKEQVTWGMIILMNMESSELAGTPLRVTSAIKIMLSSIGVPDDLVDIEDSPEELFYDKNDSSSVSILPGNGVAQPILKFITTYINRYLIWDHHRKKITLIKPNRQDADHLFEIAPVSQGVTFYAKHKTSVSPPPKFPFLKAGRASFMLSPEFNYLITTVVGSTDGKNIPTSGHVVAFNPYSAQYNFQGKVYEIADEDKDVDWLGRMKGAFSFMPNLSIFSGNAQLTPVIKVVARRQFYYAGLGRYIEKFVVPGALLEISPTDIRPPRFNDVFKYGSHKFVTSNVQFDFGESGKPNMVRWVITGERIANPEILDAIVPE